MVKIDAVYPPEIDAVYEKDEPLPIEKPSRFSIPDPSNVGKVTPAAKFVPEHPLVALAEGFTGGTASLFYALHNASVGAGDLARSLNIPLEKEPGFFKQFADTLNKAHGYWKSRLADVGGPQEFLGKVVGGLGPGYVEYAAGSIAAGVGGAAEAHAEGKGPADVVWSGAKAAAIRFTVGHLLKMYEHLDNPKAAKVLSGITFSGASALQGGGPEEAMTSAALGYIVGGGKEAPEALRGEDVVPTLPKIGSASSLVIRQPGSVIPSARVKESIRLQQRGVLPPGVEGYNTGDGKTTPFIRDINADPRVLAWLQTLSDRSLAQVLDKLEQNVSGAFRDAYFEGTGMGTDLESENALSHVRAELDRRGMSVVGEAGVTTRKWFNTSTPLPYEPHVQSRIDDILRKPVKAEQSEVLRVPGTPPKAVTATNPVKADVLDQYFKDLDGANFETNVHAAALQKEIAQTLGKKRYNPIKDPETRDASLAMMVYIDSAKYPENTAFLPDCTPEQRRIYDLSTKLPPKLKALADKVVEMEKASGERAQAAGAIKSVMDNHIAHIWDFNDKSSGDGAKFRTKTPFARQRTLTTGGILEGWAKGYNLKVEDVTLAHQLSGRSINSAIAGSQLIKAGQESGLMSTKAKAPDGFEEIQHPAAAVWKFAGEVETDPTAPVTKGEVVRRNTGGEVGKVLDVQGDTASVHYRTGDRTEQVKLADLKAVRPYSENFFINDDGTVMERVKLYAEPELAKKLNAIWSPSAIKANPIGKEISFYEAALKQNFFAFSAFHPLAFMRDLFLGTKGFKNMNPITAYKAGKMSIENLAYHGRKLIENGMTDNPIQDFDARVLDGKKTIWGKAIDLTSPGEAAHTFFTDMMHKQQKFIFGTLMPYFKMHAGIVEVLWQLKKNAGRLERGEVTHDQIYKAVAETINNRFGGLHLQRLGRSATMTDFIHNLILAPDWWESHLRQMVNAVRRGETGRVAREYWGRMAMRAIAVNVTSNLIMSMFDDKDFIERYKIAWKSGNLRWLETDITPLLRLYNKNPNERMYVNVLGRTVNDLRLLSAGLHSKKGAGVGSLEGIARSKGSFKLRGGLDLLTEHDWQGRSFTSVGELVKKWHTVEYSRKESKKSLVSKIPSMVINELSQFSPVQIQNTIAVLDGQTDAVDGILKAFGGEQKVVRIK